MAAPSRTLTSSKAERAGKSGKKTQVWVSRLLLILFCAVFLLPLYWMVVTALKTNHVVCYLKSTPEWSRLKAAILRLTRVLSEAKVLT